MKSSLAFLICGLVLHQTLGLDTIIDGGNLVLTTNANSTHVTFIAVREGTGYVGIGISPDGTGMTGADIVIAGCDDDTQEPYAVDYIGTGNSRPTEDSTQDVVTVSCSQNGTHSIVEFVRPIQTEDVNQDVPIQRGDVPVIWALGSSDSVMYHGTSRGVVLINILGN